MNAPNSRPMSVRLQDPSGRDITDEVEEDAALIQYAMSRGVSKRQAISAVSWRRVQVRLEELGLRSPRG